MTRHEALNAFGAHVNERCAECRPHRGHIPLGLCEEGLRLFRAIEDPASVTVPPCKPNTEHQWETLKRCKHCGFQEVQK
jgi:hypothetical protein